MAVYVSFYNLVRRANVGLIIYKTLGKLLPSTFDTQDRY